MGVTIASLILHGATLCQRYFKRVTSHRLTALILTCQVCFGRFSRLHDNEMK
jgi:hypothetical protein